MFASLILTLWSMFIIFYSIQFNVEKGDCAKAHQKLVVCLFGHFVRKSHTHTQRAHLMHNIAVKNKHYFDFWLLFFDGLHFEKKKKKMVVVFMQSLHISMGIEFLPNAVNEHIGTLTNTSHFGGVANALGVTIA